MKVLIVSHNVLGLDGNMGKTLHAYFQDWKTEDLCQLYFHSEVPTTHLCEEYFRITDFDLVNALRLHRPGTPLAAADRGPRQRLASAWASSVRDSVRKRSA